MVTVTSQITEARFSSIRRFHCFDLLNVVMEEVFFTHDKCLSTNKYKYKLVSCTTHCGSCSQEGTHKHESALHFACSSTLQWSSTHSMYYVGSTSSYDASNQLKNALFEVYKSPMKCKEFEIVTVIVQSSEMRHHNHTVCVNLHDSPSQGMQGSTNIQCV